jgi:hypothetical protein
VAAVSTPVARIVAVCYIAETKDLVAATKVGLQIAGATQAGSPSARQI